MKFLAVVFLSLAIASGFTQPLNEVESKDRVKDLVDAAVAYALSEETIAIPADNGSWGGFPYAVSNTNLTGLSHAIYDHEETDPKALTAKLRATVPKLTIEYNYQFDVKIFTTPITGDGKVKIVATNVSFDATDVEFSDIESEQISTLNGVFSIGDLSFDISGLKINGYEAPIIGKTMEYLYKLAYQVTSREENSLEASKYIRQGLNWLLYGHSIEEATQWLKNHTN